MRFKLFSRGPAPYLKAFAEGLARHGHKTFLGVIEKKYDYADCDVVVFEGLRHPRGLILHSYKKHGVPTVVLEMGHLKRPDYFQAGLGKINWLPPQDMPGDRFRRLSLDRALEKSNGYSVLLLGQTPSDAQHNMNRAEFIDWIYRAIIKIRNNTDRDIIYRPHPRVYFSYTKSQLLEPFGVDAVSRSDDRPLALDLANAHAVVTYNSTSGNEALLTGVPVFCDPCAIYAGVAGTKIDLIDNPQWVDTRKYFNRLAYAQWNLDELSSGEAWDFLKTQIVNDGGLTTDERS